MTSEHRSEAAYCVPQSPTPWEHFMKAIEPDLNQGPAPFHRLVAAWCVPRSQSQLKLKHLFSMHLRACPWQTILEVSGSLMCSLETKTMMHQDTEPDWQLICLLLATTTCRSAAA